jgi:hypothetical protein
MSTEKATCQNCEKPYEVGFQFCPYCGQKTNDELTIGVLFYNTISNYFSFDARFLKSFIPLMFRPGYLAKQFIKGKRLLYLHPAQMYLFVSVIFFFLFSFSISKQADTINRELKKTIDSGEVIVLDTVETKKQDSIKKVKDSIAKFELTKALKDNKFLTGMNDEQIDSIVKQQDFNKGMSFDFNEEEIDSLIAADASDEEIYKEMGLNEEDGWFKRKMVEQALKFYKTREGGSILRTFYDTVPLALFILLPIFALIIKLLYYNKGRYAYHLVFSFYYFSFLFTVFSILIGLNFIWDVPLWIDLLIALSTFIYLVIALKHFYSQGLFLSWFKGSIATFMFLAIVIPTAAIIIGLFAFMFY